MNKKDCERRAPQTIRSGVIVPLLCAINLLFVASCSAFVPSSSRGAHLSLTPQRSNVFSKRVLDVNNHHHKDILVSNTSLRMSRDGDGPGLLTTLGGIFIIILFVGTSLIPLTEGGSDRNLSISDSVVTAQDSPEKLRNYEAKGDRLSRSSIQEKLNAVPVFYSVDADGTMGTDIYLSYEDAKEAMAGSDSTIQATTLDQVAYPLILKRGRMRMAAPPAAIQKAEDELNSEENESPKTYRLVASKTSIKDAAGYNMNVGEGDFPLFVADRLAFAGSRGAQLPLFLEKEDCIQSYERLRAGSSRLPETPNIRTTTLKVELDSMERGTRPGVSQLAFYASVPNLMQAGELMQ